MTDPPPPSLLRRDIVTAYVATGAKVASWALITSFVYRFSRADFAILALARATLGLLNYTSLGLAPAMVRHLALSQVTPAGAAPVTATNVIPYRTPAPPDPTRDVYSNGLAVALLVGVLGAVPVASYALVFGEVHDLPHLHYLREAQHVVIWLGVGSLLRLMSDASGAVIQTRGMIALDNKCLIGAEVSWLIWTLVFAALDGTGWGMSRFSDGGAGVSAGEAALGYAASGAVLLLARWGLAAQHTGVTYPEPRALSRATISRLLGFGLLVSVAQLADFLYAPVDYMLINRLLSPFAVATYAPAVQIDAALLLTTSALATVLLPRAAIAHAAGDRAALGRYYVRGTAVSVALLALASAVVWLIAPTLLRVWLGRHWAHADTLAILPLVLIHTILGGSSAVGRSILLGMGKVKPFAAAALISGVANVVLSYCFVKFLNLGLRGIIYGTIVVVSLRCAVWMPWYVLRTIRHPSTPGQSESSSAAPDLVAP